MQCLNVGKPKMSHENINTLIASIGLLIGLVTAWHQFGPSPDELEIEVTDRFEFSIPFESLRPFPKLNDEPERTIAGPVFWKAVLYNKLDRPLSIKELKTFMISEAGGLSQYSDMQLGVFDIDKKPIHFPISIESRNAKAIFIGLNIPVLKDQPEEKSCFKPNLSRRDVEVCYFSKGVDLFGNTVDYTEYPNPGGEPFISVRWPDGTTSPSFVSVIRTGDNSEFSARFQYYPSMKIN